MDFRNNTFDIVRGSSFATWTRWARFLELWWVGFQWYHLRWWEEWCLIRAPAMMNAFRKGLLDCDLNDLGFTGQICTWLNNRDDPYTVRYRLDGFYHYSGWMEYEPSVGHLDFPSLDYVSLLLHIRGRVDGSNGRKRRPWRFNAIRFRRSARKWSVIVWNRRQYRIILIDYAVRWRLVNLVCVNGHTIFTITRWSILKR